MHRKSKLAKGLHTKSKMHVFPSMLRASPWHVPSTTHNDDRDDDNDHDDEFGMLSRAEVVMHG